MRFDWISRLSLQIPIDSDNVERVAKDIQNATTLLGDDLTAFDLGTIAGALENVVTFTRQESQVDLTGWSSVIKYLLLTI